MLDAVRSQLADQYSSEAAVLSEATRRGLLLMAVEAWHDEVGQYGGLSANELARILKHELIPLFNFLLEQDELPAMLRIPFVLPPQFTDNEAATRDGIEADQVVPVPTTVTIDATAIESVQLGGQDEDWDA